MVGHELWPYISYIILRAVEANYMQNDRADLNFRGNKYFSWELIKIKEFT